MLKEKIFSVIGIIGGGISYMVGGLSSTIITLLILMIIDTLTGYMVAIIFKNSDKTETGTLKSSIGFKGLVKKCYVLLLIFVAQRLDLTLNTTYIRDCVCIGFICNEVLSILENGGLMGIEYPDILKNSIDVLKNKSKGDNK